MKLGFYLFDLAYKNEGQTTLMQLYGKSKKGQKIVVQLPFQAYCYVATEGVDRKKLEKALEDFNSEDHQGESILGWEEVKKELFAKEGNYLKITVSHPALIFELKKKLSKRGIEFYEAELSIIQLFTRDHGLTPMQLLEAEGEYLEEKAKTYRVPIFNAKTIKLQKEKPEETQEFLKDISILGVDIETYNKERSIDMEKNPILMIALYGQRDGKTFEKVLTWKNFSHKKKYIEHYESEALMLERFNELVKEFDPDIFTGYFSDPFDLPYLKHRAEKFKLEFDFAADRTGIRAKTRPGASSTASITGIMHIDTYKFVRNIFGVYWKIDSYRLDDVAQYLLGENKESIDISKLYDDWDKNRNLESYAKYNHQDTALAFRLCRDLLPAMVEFTKVLDLPMTTMTRLRMSRLVESYLLKRENEFNVLHPNKPSEDEIARRMGVSVQGAFVLEPKPAIYKDVVVFDFLSLYPSIIISHNLAGESMREKKTAGAVKVPEHELWFDTKRQAFIPAVLQDIIDLRVKLKKEIKKQKANGEDTTLLASRLDALKVLANSFYGYLGFYGARWYSKDAARAITAYARDYITTVIKKAEKEGFQVIYSDTDSVMIALGEKTQKQAHDFVDEINKNLPGQMELEFEGFFPRALFVGSKGSEKGAKKKYALLDDKDVVKIVGFETVRRNWSQFAKDAQKEFLNYVLRDKVDEGLGYLRGLIKDLRAKKIPAEKMRIKMQLTRPLEKYKSIGPHVAVAKRMKEQGFPITKGMLIEFIIEEGKGLIREKAKRLDELTNGKKGYDVDYYLNNQLMPAVSSILHVLKIDEDELFKESSQKGLAAFS